MALVVIEIEKRAFAYLQRDFTMCIIESFQPICHSISERFQILQNNQIASIIVARKQAIRKWDRQFNTVSELI